MSRAEVRMSPLVVMYVESQSCVCRVALDTLVSRRVYLYQALRLRITNTCNV